MKNLVFAMLALSVSIYAQTSSGKEIVVNGKNLAEKLQWLQANAESNTQYSIVVSGNEKISSQTLSYAGKRRVTVRLSGTAGKEKAISLSSGEPLFTVGDYVTLILDKNITLQGSYRSNSELVIVNSGGTLIMNAGAKIFDNGYYGVSLSQNAKFTMTGGEISGIIYDNISGVYISKNAIFTMEGGKISGNTAGVNVAEGIFIMENGEISGNTTGGVHVQDGTTFTMKNGKISGNEGYGVYAYENAIFTMEGGKISGNEAGVKVSKNAKFTMANGEISSNRNSGVKVEGNFAMTGGEISGNNGNGVSVKGGKFTLANGKISGNKDTGVYVEGDFTMTGGEISGHTISSEKSYVGGGVDVSENGTFNMVGGEISNNTVSSDSKGYGGGIYLSGSATFTMKNGKIYGNSVSGKSGGYGGGLCVGKGENNDYAKFVMEGGEIYGNKASDEGGGIYVDVNKESDGFIMIDGEIYGNKAIWAGGGVYVGSGNFGKGGGTIYGYAKGDDKSNRVKEVTSTNDKEGGHTIYINGNPVVRIDTTSNENIGKILKKVESGRNLFKIAPR